MVAPRDFLTVILVSGLLSAKTCVAGSRRSCPTSAVVDLTDEKPDSSGFVNKSGFSFPREARWFENGTTFGCKCEFHICLVVCCFAGFGASAESCVQEDPNSLIPASYHSDNDSRHSSEKYDRRQHLFTDYRCDLDSSHDYTLKISNYEILKDGSIYQADVKQLHEIGNYCLFREPNSSFYSAKICSASADTSIDIWFIVCLNVSLLFALATFIIHSVVPENKNLQGITFRSFLAAYILCILTVEICVTQSSSPTTVFALFGFFGFHYFLNACGLWLNVMSFEVWQNFRYSPFGEEENTVKNDKAKFISYSIYAWGGAAIITSILAGFFLVGVENASNSVSVCLTMGPPMVTAVCNLFPYVSTVIRMKQWKMETTDLITDLEKAYDKQKKWFASSLKLFIIMTGPLIFMLAAIVWDNSVFSWVVSTVQTLQGIPIFLTFAWRENIELSFSDRFYEMGQLRSFRRSDSTSVTETSTKRSP